MASAMAIGMGMSKNGRSGVLAQDEAVCYVRLSLRGEDSESIFRQTALTEQEADRRRCKPVMFTEPEGHRSGRSERSRPAWKKAKDYVQVHHGRIKYFIVQDTDRVSRNVIDRLEFLKWLRGLGVQFISLLEPDFADKMPAAQRNLMEVINAGVSQHYADWISEKMKNHWAFIKSKGGKMGKPPYGLKGVGKGIERKWVSANDDKFEIAKLVLQLYVEKRVGCYQIAKTLRSRGVYHINAHGEKELFLPHHVDTIISLIQHYQGIMDDALVSAALERRRERAGRRENGRVMEKHPTPMLSRMLHCAECGSRLRAKINSGPREYQLKSGETRVRKYDQYFYFHPHESAAEIACSFCGRSVAMHHLDMQVWNDLLEFFVLSERQKQEIAKLASTPVPSQTETHRKKLEKRLRNLEMRYLDDEIPKEDYLELKDEIQNELKSLPTVETPLLIPPEVAVERLGSVVDLLKSSYERDSDDVNTALRAIIEKVYVEGHDIVGYTPRHWCAALFPPEKRRAPSA